MGCYCCKEKQTIKSSSIKQAPSPTNKSQQIMIPSNSHLLVNKPQNVVDISPDILTKTSKHPGGLENILKHSEELENLAKESFENSDYSKAEKYYLASKSLSIPLEISFDELSTKRILTSKSPFFYLTNDSRTLLLQTSKIQKISGSQVELIKSGKIQDSSPLLILQGSVIASDPSSTFCEKLNQGDSFGFDICLFKTTSYSITTDSETCILMAFSNEVILEMISKEKRFASIIGRNLLYKQDVFQSINKFLIFINQGRKKGIIKMQKLVKLYENIDSSMHPDLNSKELDLFAWRYALERLPDCIADTFVFILTTTLPEIYQNDDFITEVASKSRKRTVLKTSPGKILIVLRDSETDLIDLLSNLCIHYLESLKLRQRLKQPGVLQNLTKLTSIDFLPLTEHEKLGIQIIWGHKSAQVIRSLILHHEDYHIRFDSSPANLRSTSSEKWIEELWKACQKAMGIDLSASEAVQNGLRVDVIQGSTKTFKNMVSPYYRFHKSKILNWFKNSGLSLKTKEFLEETDELYAAGFYYFKEFPDQLELKKQMEEAVGIISMENTEMTGVKVYIANVSSLAMSDLKAKGKNHLIVGIGNAFGQQAYDIIKCFSLLFGKSIDSFAFLGKARGLIGNRKEILLASKFFNMVTKDIMTVNPKGINRKYLERLGLAVHEGGMLTVPGTIVQNLKVLSYYKHIESCVGLEMEGYYYAQAVQEGIDMSLINSKVPTRFLYYVSDLPLDPNRNMAIEGENVDWDEGVPTMNAMMSLCIKMCGNKYSSQISDRLTNFIKKHKKIALIHKYWDIAQEILNLGIPVVAFVSTNEDLPVLTGNIVFLDYLKEHDVLIQMDEISSAFEEDEKMFYAIFDQPDDGDFFHSKYENFREMLQDKKIYFPQSNTRFLHYKSRLAIGCKTGQEAVIYDAWFYFEKNNSAFRIRRSNQDVFITASDIAIKLIS